MDLIDFLKTDVEKVKFSELLLHEFQKYGYGTLSKNDLQDLMIHCCNKASNEDFLSDFSNYELARCLKTTDRKIKNMRMNITQKYDDLDSKQQLLKLFQKVTEDKIKLEYEYDNDIGYISLVIENNVIKRELETISKKLGHTINYKRNREIVIIKTDLFLDIVEYLNDLNQNDIYGGIIKNEQQLRKNQEIQELKKQLKESVSSFTKDVIIGIASNVIQGSMHQY